MAARKVSQFKEWLEKQERYYPQPYEQLAKILRKEGYPEKADELLYAGKNRELSEVEGLWDWLRSVLLKVFIGYGYKNFRVLFWFLGFCSLGMFLLHISGQRVDQKMKYWGLAYSLDMLMPIIELHKSHYEIQLGGWVRVYFYAHKVLGYILGFFLIAGLSGLTKLSP